MANRRDYKKLAKYDPLTWKITGPNKARKLDNIPYSLNEDDYQDPYDFEWMKLLAHMVSSALEDIARYPTNSVEYKMADKFIFSDNIEVWLIAFGYNVDVEVIRSKARKIISEEACRQDFLSWCAQKRRADGKIRHNDEDLNDI